MVKNPNWKKADQLAKYLQAWLSSWIQNYQEQQ